MTSAPTIVGGLLALYAQTDAVAMVRSLRTEKCGRCRGPWRQGCTREGPVGAGSPSLQPRCQWPASCALLSFVVSAANDRLLALAKRKDLSSHSAQSCRSIFVGCDCMFSPDRTFNNPCHSGQQRRYQNRRFEGFPGQMLRSSRGSPCSRGSQSAGHPIIPQY